MGKQSKYKLNGYPIPPSWRRHILFINGTPHVSQRAAALHQAYLQVGEYATFLDDIRGVLLHTLSEDHKGFIIPIIDSILEIWSSDKAHYRKRNITSALIRNIIDSIVDEGTINNPDYMMDKLLEDQLEAKHDPLFSSSDVTHIKRVLLEFFTQPDKTSNLDKYERKLLFKYFGDSTRRSGSGYIAQVENYLPSRGSFIKGASPDLGCYERALDKYFTINGVHYTRDAKIGFDCIDGWLSRARKTTYGGYPYYHNMGDFVSEDESIPTTYADLYNKLALVYLIAPCWDKLALSAYIPFVALERVQPGGVDPEDMHAKDNKQRFVQAQSAVISHALKLVIDSVIAKLRSTRANFVCDKFSEDFTTQTVLQYIKNGSAESKYIINFVGTDFDNYDSSLICALINDVAFSYYRSLMPASFTTHIIDPYFIYSYRQSRISVPRYGYVQTTGVKSGMVDTNIVDTLCCDFIDMYELAMFHPNYLEDPKLSYAIECRSANGDDRLKLSPCNASEIEAADATLQIKATSTKQEITPAGAPVSDTNVSYLKTIIVSIDGKIVRTDSVAKLILARILPEHPVSLDHSASFFVDTVMSSARSVQSPYLFLLVDFLYTYNTWFRALLTGLGTVDELMKRFVYEQMSILHERRGSKWMRRKGMDFESIVEQQNLKFGYGEEGHRGTSVGMLDSNDTVTGGFSLLPAYQAIMLLGYERLNDGTIGSSFSTVATDDQPSA